MSKQTEFWENYDRFYADFEKEGLNLDDLLLKNKFAFNNGKLTFSSKSKFNFGTKVAASHEHSLKAKVFKGNQNKTTIKRIISKLDHTLRALPLTLLKLAILMLISKLEFITRTISL
jgi:hypothetical protein